MVYVLTFEYSDKSAFRVCGVTESHEVAEAWFRANDETNVYAIAKGDLTTRWIDGLDGWRKERSHV